MGDMIPHLFIECMIIDCMNMFGTLDKGYRVIQNSMKQWNTELTAGNQVLGEVCIKRRIFQGITFPHYCLYWHLSY